MIGSQTGLARQLEFENALVSTSIVVAIYVFVGNSGVISFGHISFVAVGAFLAGILTLEAQQKDFVLPEMFPVLRHAHVGIVQSLALAALAGAIYALVVGIPLMRLSGLPAGIATFAVLGITYNVLSYWPKIGPGLTALALIPESGIWTLTVGALIAIVVAFAYQRSPFGRRLRATKEDPQAAQSVGHRRAPPAALRVRDQRRARRASRAACSCTSSARSRPQQVYLDLTFLTLAMLVVGGVASLWGAVVGALLVSGLDSFLNDAEQGMHVGFRPHAPGRDAPRRDRRADGDRPDPAAVRDHRRARGHAPAPARASAGAS